MLKKTEIGVQGMTCTNCAISVEKALEKEGLEHIFVDISNKTVSFNNEAEVGEDTIEKAIKKAGYTIAPSHANNSEHGHTHSATSNLLSVRNIFIIAALFTIPLLLTMFIPKTLEFGEFLHNRYVQLFLATPVMLIGLFHFGKSAFKSLKAGSPNMDVLITMGSLAAFIYSVVGAFVISPLAPENFMFFETAATIITLVLLGNLIEEIALKRTNTEIDEIQSTAPKKAKKLIFNFMTNEDEVEEIDIDKVQKDDIIIINTGEIIPTDGIITQGNGLIDESAITGESEPISKGAEAKVLGGTFLSDGTLTIKALTSGDNSAIRQIIDWVRDARASKPSIQKLADKISVYFVTIIIAISFITFALNFLVFDISLSNSILRAVAVLVVSCPCAMGLATPTAVSVGLGRAAKEGILYKGGNILESMAQINNLVLDKTGTLTDGQFVVSEFRIAEGDENHWKNTIINLEKYSDHPIAKSILKNNEAWKSSQIDFVDAKEEKGRGITAKDKKGNTFYLGNPKGMDIPKECKTSDVVLSYNGSIVAGFKIKDKLISDTYETVRKFENSGIKLHLLSGDNEYKVKTIANQLGVENYKARALPIEKSDYIKSIDDDNKITAMVGDGINDTPAFMVSDIAISFTNGRDFAKQNANILLVHGSLEKLWRAFRIAKFTLKGIKQNLFWALAYNVVAIPLAAMGFLNPMLAAFTMAFSDIVVIGNAIRLRYIKIE